MSKCRYDLSEDCNNTDCLNCVLGKIRAEIMQVVAEEKTEDSRWALGLKYSIKIINKYKAAEREKIPDLRVAAEQAAEGIQNLTKAGISQEDIESIDWPFYDADTRRIRFSKPENMQKLKEYERDDMAIKTLEQEPCKVSEYDKDHIWYKGRQYISLRRFLEVITEPKAKWIPVSERLPEFNGRYLTSLPSRLIHEEYTVMILNFAKNLYGVPNKKVWYEYDSNMVLNEVPDVIAWMPFPKPYESESENIEKALKDMTFCGPSDPDYADKEAMSFRQWLFNGFDMTVEQFESSTTAYGKKFFHNQYLKYLNERNAITTGKATGVAE